MVDDGGSSPEPVLARFRHALGGGGRLTLVSHDRNRGLAAARNTGMRLARGRFVGFLDDDDRLLPNHLAALLPTLRRGARVVYGDVRSVIETPSSPLPTTESMVLHYQFEYEAASYAVENYFPVHALLCERSLLLEAGPFDESLPVLEDWELWLRVFRISLPRHVRRVTAEVRQRSDGSNMTMERRCHWAEVSAQVYARTLDLEERDPQLRKRRVLAYSVSVSP